MLKIALFIEKINQKKFYILNFYISKCKFRNVRVEQHNHSIRFSNVSRIVLFWGDANTYMHRYTRLVVEEVGGSKYYLLQLKHSSWYMNKEDVMCRKVVKIDSCGSHTHHTVDNFCPWKFPDKRGWCKHTWGTRIECAVFATIIAIYWIKKSSNHQDQSFR